MNRLVKMRFPGGLDKALTLSYDDDTRHNIRLVEILNRYGIAKEEAMAFGDSENDLEMLKAAGIGVAMGNGSAESKAIADYVTTDCDEGGILNALKHFKLL